MRGYLAAGDTAGRDGAETDHVDEQASGRLAVHVSYYLKEAGRPGQLPAGGRHRRNTARGTWLGFITTEARRLVTMLWRRNH